MNTHVERVPTSYPPENRKLAKCNVWQADLRTRRRDHAKAIAGCRAARVQRAGGRQRHDGRVVRPDPGALAVTGSVRPLRAKHFAPTSGCWTRRCRAGGESSGGWR